MQRTPCERKEEVVPCHCALPGYAEVWLSAYPTACLFCHVMLSARDTLNVQTKQWM